MVSPGSASAPGRRWGGFFRLGVGVGFPPGTGTGAMPWEAGSVPGDGGRDVIVLFGGGAGGWMVMPL